MKYTNFRIGKIILKGYMTNSAGTTNSWFPAVEGSIYTSVEVIRWPAVTLWNDAGYGAFSLHFIRDKEKREVDFLIADERKPLLLVETKLYGTSPPESLVRFQNTLGVPAVQLVNSSALQEVMNCRMPVYENPELIRCAARVCLRPGPAHYVIL